MHQALETFGLAFCRATERERLLALSEGYVKIRAMEVALSLGWTIQEGAGHSPTGPVADYLSLSGKKLSGSRSAPTLADVRVC